MTVLVSSRLTMKASMACRAASAKERTRASKGERKGRRRFAGEMGVEGDLGAAFHGEGEITGTEQVAGAVETAFGIDGVWLEISPLGFVGETAFGRGHDEARAPFRAEGETRLLGRNRRGPGILGPPQSLGFLVETAILDVRPEDELERGGVAEEFGGLIGFTRAVKHDPNGVLVRKEVEADAKAGVFSHADGKGEQPLQSAVVTLREALEMRDLDFSGVTAIDEPPSQTCQEHAPIHGIGGVRIGGQEGVVLAAKFSPRSACVCHRTPPVGGEPVNVLLDDVTFGDGEGDVRRIG